MASLSCTDYIERVDVDVSFIGTNPQFNTLPGKTPRPRENTAEPSTMTTTYDWLGIQGLGLVDTLSSIYSGLASTEMEPHLHLDPFFSHLVSSRYAISLSDFGDPTANEKVAEAIKFQHNIIMAQTLAQQRVDARWSNVTLTSATLATSANISDADMKYPANITDPYSRQRVVQDAASTHALTALLGIALVLLIISWIYLPNTDVLPRAPTSIASVAALIAGGNLLDKLPPDAQQEWCDDSDIAAALGENTKFWLGWGLVPDVEGQEMCNENENGIRRFGIFAVEPEDEDGTKGVDGEGEEPDGPSRGG